LITLHPGEVEKNNFPQFDPILGGLKTGGQVVIGPEAAAILAPLAGNGKYTPSGGGSHTFMWDERANIAKYRLKGKLVWRGVVEHESTPWIELPGVIVDGHPGEVGLNVYNLANAAVYWPEGFSMEVHATNAVAPVLVRNNETRPGLYIIMPMRMDLEPEAKSNPDKRHIIRHIQQKWVDQAVDAAFERVHQYMIDAKYATVTTADVAQALDLPEKLVYANLVQLRSSGIVMNMSWGGDWSRI
jgi:hypothetical protein